MIQAEFQEIGSQTVRIVFGQNSKLFVRSELNTKGRDWVSEQRLLELAIQLTWEQA